jgi:tRNA(fMet)-specific endonuclease VapC
VSSYLLDTDIAVELLRGRSVDVAARLASESRQTVFLSTVTVAELIFGALRSRDSVRSIALCRRFCDAFQIVELDRAAAEQSGLIRADLEGRGERIGAYDVLIAGIAVAHDYVLATHNVREFRRVTGLQIEDWAEPR